MVAEWHARNLPPNACPLIAAMVGMGNYISGIPYEKWEGTRQSISYLLRKELSKVGVFQ
jgi:hypothetical protein